MGAVSAMWGSSRAPKVRYCSVIVCRSIIGSLAKGRSESFLGSIAAVIFCLRIFSSSRSWTRMPSRAALSA